MTECAEFRPVSSGLSTQPHEHEGAAPPRRAAHLHLAAQVTRLRPHDGQAQAMAVAGGLAVVKATVGIEQLRQALGRDALAVVADAQAQAVAASALQQLKSTFLEPNEGHADFLRKLENCTDEVRHNAREVTRLAMSLDNNSFEALEVASHLLERGPSNLLVATPLGPWSLSKQAIDVNLLYRLTGDIGVLLGPQPADQGNLLALHAEWAQEDDAIAPYAPQR